MPLISGLAGQFGFAAETQWGLPVTVTRFVQFVEESVQQEIERLESDSIIQGALVGRSAQWSPSIQTVNGDVGQEVMSGGQGLFWHHALGSATWSGTNPCTMTFTPGDLQGKGLTMQFGRPARSGLVVPFTYCVDEQTEVLTQRGWVTHHSLDVDDVVLTHDPATREITWEQVEAVNRFDWDGPLTRWKSRRIDALTTPNHRWLVETGRRRSDPRPTLDACPICGATSGKNGSFPNSGAIRGHMVKAHGVQDAKQDDFACSIEYIGDPTFRTTEELADRSDSVIVGGGTPACFGSAPVYSDEFVELIGWVVTEGHYQAGSQGVLVAQDEVANPDYVERIRHLAEHFRTDGVTVSEYHYPEQGGASHHWYFGKGIGQVIRDAAPLKQLTPTFLLSLTREQGEKLFSTLIDGDGTRRTLPRIGESWAQKDQGRIDGFQMLAAMLGKRTWAHLNTDGSGCSTVTVHQQTLIRPGVSDYASKEDYVGTVWCPTTRTGTWLARRNGCTFWTGNSGCKIGSWEVAMNVGEIATFGLTVIGKSETTGTGLASPTYDADVRPMNFAFGSLAVGNSSLCVRSATIAGENNLADDRVCFGQRTIDEPAQMDLREYTGSFEVEFGANGSSNDLELYNRYVNGEEALLTLTMRNATSTASLKFLGNMRFDGETPTIGGKDLLTYELSGKFLGPTSDAGALTIVYTTPEDTQP